MSTAVADSFEHDSARSEHERLDHLRLVDRRCQHQDPGRSREFRHGAQRLESGHFLHGQVEEENVRLLRHGEFERLLGVRRLTDDRHIRLDLEQPPQAVPENGMVVDNADTHRRRGTSVHDARCKGISISIREPDPGLDSTTSSAPINRARSPIVRGPRCNSSSWA